MPKLLLSLFAFTETLPPHFMPHDDSKRDETMTKSKDAQKLKESSSVGSAAEGKMSQYLIANFLCS